MINSRPLLLIPPGHMLTVYRFSISSSTATSLGSLRLLHSSPRSMSPLIQNSHRPPNWKSVAPAPPPRTTTFSLQPTLPKLPLPEIPKTLEKLKASLKVLARDEAEWQATKRKVDEFAESALSKELHGRLEQRRKDKEHWLEELWDDVSS